MAPSSKSTYVDGTSMKIHFEQYLGMVVGICWDMTPPVVFDVFCDVQMGHFTTIATC